MKTKNKYFGLIVFALFIPLLSWGCGTDFADPFPVQITSGLELKPTLIELTYTTKISSAAGASTPSLDYNPVLEIEGDAQSGGLSSTAWYQVPSDAIKNVNESTVENNSQQLFHRKTIELDPQPLRKYWNDTLYEGASIIKIRLKVTGCGTEATSACQGQIAFENAKEAENWIPGTLSLLYREDKDTSITTQPFYYYYVMAPEGFLTVQKKD